VKELNPGFDLLLATDWDERLSTDAVPIANLEPSSPPAKAELVPIPSGASPADQAVVADTAPARVNESTTGPSPGRAPTRTWIAIAGMLLLVSWILIATRRAGLRGSHN
jgi:hypothetical protein